MFIDLSYVFLMRSLSLLLYFIVVVYSSQPLGDSSLSKGHVEASDPEAIANINSGLSGIGISQDLPAANLIFVDTNRSGASHRIRNPSFGDGGVQVMKEPITLAFKENPGNNNNNGGGGGADWTDPDLPDCGPHKLSCCYEKDFNFCVYYHDDIAGWCDLEQYFFCCESVEQNIGERCVPVYATSINNNWNIIIPELPEVLPTIEELIPFVL